MKYIFGSSGQIGSLFAKVYPDAYCFKGRIENRPAVTAYLSKLDSNDTVILAAAMTNVDSCENYPNLSYLSNVIGVKHIVDAVCKANASLVFYSTDYIFDGVRGAYSVDDVPNPINVYGRHKLCAENYILSKCKKYWIIRTNMIYGEDAIGRNYTFRLLNEVSAGNEFKAPVDEWVTPTNNVELVGQTTCLMETKQYGVVHAVGSTLTNRYNFACKVVEMAGLDVNKIKPVTSSSLSRLAKRPLNGGLIATHDCGNLHDGIVEMLSGKKGNDHV